MKTYQEVLEDAINKAKNNPKIKVVVAQEVNNLSKGELKAIYMNDTWILAEDKPVIGSLVEAVKDRLTQLLNVDLLKSAKSR